jgi:hypothetical protein
VVTLSRRRGNEWERGRPRRRPGEEWWWDKAAGRDQLGAVAGYGTIEPCQAADSFFDGLFADGGKIERIVLAPLPST